MKWTPPTTLLVEAENLAPTPVGREWDTMKMKGCSFQEPHLLSKGHTPSCSAVRKQNLLPETTYYSKLAGTDRHQRMEETNMTQRMTTYISCGSLRWCYQCRSHCRDACAPNVQDQSICTAVSVGVTQMPCASSCSHAWVYRAEWPWPSLTIQSLELLRTLKSEGWRVGRGIRTNYISKSHSYCKIGNGSFFCEHMSMWIPM